MALAWFQSLDGNTTIQLDATQNLDRTRRGTLTTSRVEDGSRISDHYETEPIFANFSGIITDIKIRGEGITPSPREYVRLVDEMMLAQTPFVFHTSDDDIPSINNALITEFRVMKEASVGRGLRVNMAVQQIDITTAAQVTTIRLSPSFIDQGSSAQNGGDGFTKQVSDTDRDNTLLVDVLSLNF